MAQPPHGAPPEDELVDETAAESFPASDAPSWSAMHAGAPAPRPWVAEHGLELRASLRADLERLAHAAAEVAAAVRRGELAPPAVQDLVAAAMLDAGRAVVREPVDDSLRTWNVEAEYLGADRDAPCAVIGSRCTATDASGAAMLLAVLRALAPARTRRTMRFVVFANERGSGPYVERLRAERKRVHAMLALERLDLARGGERSRVVFVANLSSRFAARAARDAFRASSRIPARAIALPSWLPGIAVSDHAAFWRQHMPAVLVTDAPPWRASRRSAGIPDIDRMAAAVPGLAAAVVRLAGGRI